MIPLRSCVVPPLLIALLGACDAREAEAADVRRKLDELRTEIQDYATMKKQELVTHLEQGLETIDENLRHLREKAEQAGAGTRQEIEQKLRDLEQRRDRVAGQLDELRDRSGEAWQDLRAGVSDAMDDLSKAVGSAWDHLGG